MQDNEYFTKSSTKKEFINLLERDGFIVDEGKIITQIQKDIPINESYPFKISLEPVPELIRDLLIEIGSAYSHQLQLLCGIGVRMLLEAVCNDQGLKYQYDENNQVKTNRQGRPITNNLHTMIDKLNQLGIITNKQKEILLEIKELGNQTAHEIKRHESDLIRQMLEVVEHIIFQIYHLEKLKFKP
ncbi:DUF4145 domain-containing protein [Laceyella putida]|uniref:DUF4145 domain-containing protein n=1 Tax=Laceyella putida TaxID=110101 RepID=A0ABW2RNH6_9BACL